MDIPVAILAGGLATRLGALTARIPKSLLPVCGEPFLSYQLDLIKKQGIRRVILCLGHLGEMIQKIFGNGAGHGVELFYSFDGGDPLGTGGALRKAEPLLGETFFVMYGDSYLPINFQEIHREFNSGRLSALMTVLKNHNRWETSNVCYEGGQVLIYGKRHPTSRMHHVDYGLSLISTHLLREFNANTPWDLGMFFSTLAQKGVLGGYETTQRFYEVGSTDGIKDFEQFIETQRPK